MLSVTLNIKVGPLSNPMNNSSPNLGIISSFQKCIFLLSLWSRSHPNRGYRNSGMARKEWVTTPFPRSTVLWWSKNRFVNQ